MGNRFGAPEISVFEVAELRRSRPGEAIFVDVREPFELTLAAIPGDDILNVPMSVLASRGVDALPETIQDHQREVIVICHHGIRSAQVTVWLLQMGWTDVKSMAGGIDLYAQQIDPTVGAYE